MQENFSYGSLIEEHSYDAWGNHRNPANWNLEDFSSALGIRGYTGHEMLPHFQLINMNGRMYDPVIGRVLSPDNIVQNLTNAQSFNRYSYCLNNPLKFIDPTGEKWKWWQWTLLGMGLSDPATASATIVTTGGGLAGIAGAVGATGYITTSLQVPIIATADAIFTNYDGASVLTNSFKISNGLFVTDPNKSFWGRTWEFFSRVTWQSPQTAIGFSGSQGTNLCGFVNRVGYGYGATVLNTSLSKFGAVTLGNYIIGNSEIEVKTDNKWFQHEYGHYIQSQRVGGFYLTGYGLTSLISASLNDEKRFGGDFFKHKYLFIEQDANALAYQYFCKNVDGFIRQNEDGTYTSDWKFEDNPILGCDGTTLGPIGYKSDFLSVCGLSSLHVWLRVIISLF